MTLQEVKAALEERRNEKYETYKKVMEDFISQDMSEKSFLSGKRIVDRNREYIKALNFALHVIEQLETLESPDNHLSFETFIECKIRESLDKKHMYSPDSPNYNRLSGRIQALKEMKEAYNDLYHCLPDDLLKEVAQWVDNHEKDMVIHGLNSYPYYYARGYRNAIVDVFDILKQFGYDNKGYIPEQ